MVGAVRAGLEQGSDVVVATPPYLSPGHQAQQRSLAARLALEFAREPRFHYVDLGNAIDPNDAALSEDGVHPTPAGGRIIATRLADAMYERIRARVQ
jgi:lysophospholipase L1-like esterase